jgi:hypothetical protein
MKAKLIVEGKEFDIEIQDPELQKLVMQKKTGYERVDMNHEYYADYHGDAIGNNECADGSDELLFNSANYYSDSIVAENNARADKLMRQLRRFAVEHRENDIDWSSSKYKYIIRYVHSNNTLIVYHESFGHEFGTIVFDSEASARLAIDTFHDELMWYFTEYKDSL